MMHSLIIFLWFKGMTREVITKFEGSNIKMVGNDYSFYAGNFDGILYILILAKCTVFGDIVIILKYEIYVKEDITILSRN